MDGDINDYLNELTVCGRAPNTLRIRRTQLQAWARWLRVNDIEQGTVTRADCVRFLGRFPAPETRAAYRAAIRGYHAWLVDTGRAAHDPTRRLPAVTCPEGDPRPIPDHILANALATATPQQQAMLLLGRFAGLRAAEIANAHHDYLQPGPVIRLRGKGNRVRELPAHPRVVPLLEQAAGPLFPSAARGGMPVRPATVSTALARLLPDPWTAHSLRHAFATEAYERTHDLLLVQRWLGHSRPTTTVRYIRTQHDHQAMNQLHLAAA